MIKRKTFIFLFVLCLLAAVFSLTAYAQEGDAFVVDGIAYWVRSEPRGELPGYVQVGVDTALALMEEKMHVEIPAQVSWEGKDYEVRAIGPMAFAGTDITSVTIPDTVMNIDAQAFEYCSRLTSVKLSKNLITISENCFSYSGLQQIEIPEGVSRIEYHAFGRCQNLEKVTLPSTLMTIEEAAFLECNLWEVEIPESVHSIGSWAFGECDNLSSVTLHAGIRRGGDSAFAASGLKELNVNCSESQWKQIAGEEIIPLGAVINYTVQDTPAATETTNIPITVPHFTTTVTEAAPQPREYPKTLIVLGIVVVILLLMELPILIGFVHSRINKRRNGKKYK